MVVSKLVKHHDGACPTAVAALAVAFLSLAPIDDARAQIQGCSGDTGSASDKVLVGSLADLGGGGERLSRDIGAAFEMRFGKAKSTLASEATVMYCSGRNVRDAAAYSRSIVEILNDEKVLLEVGARRDGQDIVMTYVVVPVRYYAFFGTPPDSEPGYHRALFDPARVSTGLQNLFKGNAELRLMAALALAIRNEKLAQGEADSTRRRKRLHKARDFYCDAMGAIDDAKPGGSLAFGLEQREWAALGRFAQDGAARLFESATSDSTYVGVLSVVKSERASDSSSSQPSVGPGIAACLQP